MILTDLYKSYTSWCYHNNTLPLSFTLFSSSLGINPSEVK